jgi:hypothetical protein
MLLRQQRSFVAGATPRRAGSSRPPLAQPRARSALVIEAAKKGGGGKEKKSAQKKGGGALADLLKKKDAAAGGGGAADAELATPVQVRRWRRRRGPGPGPAAHERPRWRAAPLASLAAAAGAGRGELSGGGCRLRRCRGGCCGGWRCARRPQPLPFSPGSTPRSPQYSDPEVTMLLLSICQSYWKEYKE